MPQGKTFPQHMRLTSPHHQLKKGVGNVFTTTALIAYHVLGQVLEIPLNAGLEFAQHSPKYNVPMGDWVRYSSLVEWIPYFELFMFGMIIKLIM